MVQVFISCVILCMSFSFSFLICTTGEVTSTSVCEAPKDIPEAIYPWACPIMDK